MYKLSAVCQALGNKDVGVTEMEYAVSPAQASSRPHSLSELCSVHATDVFYHLYSGTGLPGPDD